MSTGCARPKVQRYGSVIGIKPENIEEYKRLHADVWPGVLKTIKQCNIRNYSIYLGELERDRYYLYSYLEYTGENFEADMAKMAADETTQKWWKLTDPLQVPIPTRKKGQWWASMEEVFHCD
jgi:L-rhamnose mutarotase